MAVEAVLLPWAAPAMRAAVAPQWWSVTAALYKPAAPVREGFLPKAWVVVAAMPHPRPASLPLAARGAEAGPQAR